MSRRRWSLPVAALLVGAAAAAAVLLNLLLLSRAGAANDPIGQLRPRLAGITSPMTTVPAVRPTHGVVENDGADD